MYDHESYRQFAKYDKCRHDQEATTNTDEARNNANDRSFNCDFQDRASRRRFALGTTQLWLS